MTTDEGWATGFRTGAKKGMTCDLCRCLVRQKPGDAEAHRAWHRSLTPPGGSPDAVECVLSPTHQHLYQVVEQAGPRGDRVLRDLCRYCGEPAFERGPAPGRG